MRRRCLAELRNMGIRLKPNQLVIDIDPRNGGDEGFEKLCFDIGLDPDQWPCVLTGSGGRHYLLALPEGVSVVEMLDDYPGVEFKSIGRQVVAAGSRHPNGKLYRWSRKHPDIRKGVPMVPTNLLNAIRRPDRGAQRGRGRRIHARTTRRHARAARRAGLPRRRRMASTHVRLSPRHGRRRRSRIRRMVRGRS